MLVVHLFNRKPFIERLFNIERSFNMGVKEIAAYLKKRFLEYTVAAMLAGFLAGLALQPWITANKGLMKNLIIAFAILTIYPSMIQLKSEKLGQAARKGREILVALLFVFLAAPLIAMLFASLLPDRQVALGYVASNVVPASSASIGYVLLAEGDLELATVLAVLSLLGSLAAIPSYLGLYASMSSLTVPMDKILASVLYTLVAPFVAGQATRWLLMRYHAAYKAPRGHPSATAWIAEELKHHTQLATMASMLVLVALLVASKAGLMVKMPLVAGEILLLQVAMLAFLLGLITAIDRAARVDYEAHTAIAYISATKNQSVAAAIAVMALGPKAALVPALIPAVQAPVAIAYLHALPRLNSWLETRGKEIAVEARLEEQALAPKAGA